MPQQLRSIRPFIAAKDFETSRSFYRDLGFEETLLSAKLSVFKRNGLAFYLQNAYMEEWADNTMIFVEVENVTLFWKELQALNLPEKYPAARIEPPVAQHWGCECFVHDPSGILWHFGEFKQ